MFASKHNPHGGSSKHLDNGRLEGVIASYQTQGDTGSLSEIIRLTQDRALTLIRFHKTTRYGSEAELLSDVHFKLLRAVDKFDPGKGSAFSFVSRVVTNVLCTAVSNARRNSSRYLELDEVATSKLIERGDARARDAVDDLLDRVRRGVRSALSEPGELDTQRWYVNSFCEDGFESRRHQCANAAVAVYNLSHDRSRELYDLTMLEVRRVLYDDLKRREPIPAGRLLGTRCAWMAAYRPLLSEPEFTKFVVLMRDLAPYLLLIIGSADGSRSRRGDRNPAIGRKNLEWILSGHPDAVPLFKPKSRNWAAKLTKFMPHFLLANRTSEKLVEANVRGC